MVVIYLNVFEACPVYTINDKKLMTGLCESANRSVWQKKVWQIHPEL